MRVRPAEGVGRSLWRLGVYDLVTCELCWRLLDPGETAVDVGANIGVVTGLLARRAGPAGEVWGFEPHPDVRTELVRHVGLWQRTGLPLAKIQTHGAALSDVAGEAALLEPRSFGGNHGTASLEAVSSGSDGTNVAIGRSFKVSTQTFDAVFPPDRRVGVFKIDVEGHEPQVFAGATGALAERRVRDIVFEEHHALPSPTSELLTAAGFILFFLGRTFWGPRLTAPADRSSQPSWLPPDYLATLDPERALARCQNRGWQVLT